MLDIDFIINELGEDRELDVYSIAPPLYQTAMMGSKTVADMRLAIREEAQKPFYTRGQNLTTDILRKKIAALEGAEDALVFASGSAAVAAGILSNLQSEDHIVSVRKPYSWTNKLLTVFLPRFGIQTTFVDGRDSQNFAQAIQKNTKLFFLESPNSWTFELQNLAEIAKIAQNHQILTMIDNSYATPLYQRPIEMGIDLVVHSATKYISGHSDAMAGILCGKKSYLEKVFFAEYMTLGGIISPFNAWLLLRGLRTLPVRMKQISETTEKVVQYLENHPKINKVYHPFSPSHPQYNLAKTQMQNASGLFTIEIKADSIKEIEQICNRLKRFLMAVSWGGYESLIFPACVFYQDENQAPSDLTWNMVRVAIGLESAEVLIKDWEEALGGYSF
jgi:cystathionine beta-lyase/cystathionine gamma-synthase